VVDRQRAVLGRLGAAFGVRGWIRVHPLTSLLETLLEHPIWQLKVQGAWREYRLVEAKVHGGALVALLEGFTDRDQTQALKGREVAVWADELPQLEPGEYYWSQLIGLQVETDTGVKLGVVDRFMETGANDVFVVNGDREHWLPYLPGDVVLQVDLESRCMTVNWDPEF